MTTNEKLKATNFVSIIIPTKNNERTIAPLLNSIKNQSFKEVEVILVDGFSTDNTTKIASSFGARVFKLEGERAKAKNFGIQKSKGDFLLFLDSDMILQPQVVEECIKICSNNVAGVIIPERSIGKGFWIKVRDFERSLYAGSWMESARFFKKEYVIKVDGFDEEVIFFEESTLPIKIQENGMIVNARITSNILHDEEGFNLHKWLRKKKYYAGTADVYSKKYRKYAEKQTSVLYRINIFLGKGNWKKLIRHPILTIGAFILKTLELIFFRK